MNEYKIRQYRSGDKEAFLSLYSAVMGDEKQENWFAWKYKENPYIDHVAMMVGVFEETIVGARPFFALPVSVNGEHEVALQPGDTMVHPDHRRQGLFTRMTEQAIERYAGDHPFFFNFPNHRSRSGYLKLDWEPVSERLSYYRVENPESLGKSRADQRAVQLLSKISSPIAQGYYHFRDSTASVPSQTNIRTESEPPAKELATLYRSSTPDKIHVLRDEQFYQWRFNNPDWEYTTYIIYGETNPEAAIITGTSDNSDCVTTKFTDIIPLENPSNDALRGLFSRVLTDHTETDLFVAPPQGIPDSVLREFGFHADTVPPLSFLTTQTTHVVRALTNSWTQNGLDITDPDNWHMTFVEEDTS
ncbi:GNAT family N-acetyltransferase [Haloarcula sp. GH36]|uniref:GNAT family N-acetyltransferase n=1 Tax=Haloarcula montana TaxID=3111776 RepID=UPI002D76EFFD|nr:GNAT family N-acetyltransferase [Haloarcula sp. GH36]